jgi:hypothetical protein
MNRLGPLWFALVVPALGLAQPSPPLTSVELGPEPAAAESRAFKPNHKQAHERAENKQAYKLRVRYVRVDARWTGQIQLPLAAGDVLTPEKLAQAMEALDDAITSNSIQGYGLRSKGEVGVLYIAVDFDTNAPPTTAANAQPTNNTVGVIFRPYYLRFSLVRIGDNVLPIPRSPRPTFYDNVPKPVLALKPTFGVSYDRAFGTALGGAFETDLLNLSDPARISSSTGENRHLDVHGSGMKSMEELFYRADTGLRYSARQSGSIMQEFAARADYDGVKEPLGEGEHTRNAGLSGIGGTFKLASNTRLSIDTGYRYADDRLDDKVTATSTRTSANEQMNRALFDAIPRPIYGFLRAAVWEDNGWLTGAGGSYQRLVGRLGYAKEIPLLPNQTIGLEMVAGGGKSWGDVPEYARFFGGNSPGQFLYDSPSSSSLLNMPAGPLMRSFGQNEAGFRTASGGVRGGDAFWHVNLNLTFPIRSWSRALIPNELTDIEGADGNPLSIKQLLRKQIDVTGPSMLAAALKQQGTSAEEAEKRANQVFKEVQPATHFIVDDANLYSIKPLLMFDAAGMSGRGESSDETWLAGGGGVQLTIVTAIFEVGYMRTFSGPTFGDRGNVFVRLVFQNLF